jgi:tetratricopeptide (TPR) repeat protein
VLVMRVAGWILGFAMLCVTSVIGSAAEQVSRAGPIEAPLTQCRILKFNPKLGPPCDPPPLAATEDPAQRAAAYMRRAWFFIGLQDFPAARIETDAGLVAKPDDFELLLLSGRLAITLHGLSIDQARAERDLNRALQLKPTDSDARATYVAFMGTRLPPEELVREYNAILRHDPRHQYSRKARAKVLQSLGRHRDAVADLDVLLAGESDNSDYLRLRAVSHLALNRPQAAAEDFTRVLQADPRNIIMRTGRALAYELAGEDEKALADYDAILGPIGGPLNSALGGDRLGKYRLQRALVLVRLKRLDEAAAEMAWGLLAGKTSILRAQVFLRQNGFPALRLDGRDSPELRDALRECFAMSACFQDIKRVTL